MRPAPRGWQRLSRLAAGWLVAAALSTVAPGARAEGPLVVGGAYSGMLDLGDAQVPLPAGEWLLAGRGYDTVADMRDAAYGAIETLVLFRIEGKTVTAFATVQRNLIPIETGWGVAGECVSNDVLSRIIFDDGEGHSRCGFVAAVETAPSTASPWFWKSAEAFALNRQLTLPWQWLMAGLRLSDRRDVIDLRFYFSREAPGVAGAVPAAAGAAVVPAPSGWLDWMPGWGAGAAPDEGRPDAAAVGELDHWLQGIQSLARLGFNRKLEGVPPPAMPWTQAESTAEPVVQGLQLRRLEALKAAHIVGAQFYADRHAAIEDSQAEVAPEHLTALELTAVKAAADQSTTIVENVAVDAIVLGSVAQTLVLLPAQTLADTLQFVTHEYAWNTLGPNRVRESPTIDFIEAGTIRP